jgi:hypothetical protein
VKGNVAAFAVGAVIASSGVAGATIGSAQKPAIDGFKLKPHTAYAYGGFTCTTYDAPTPAARTLVCLRNDLKGLTLAFNATQVVGARVDPKTHKISKIVFKVANR